MLDRGQGASKPRSRRPLTLSFDGPARVRSSKAEAEASLGGVKPYSRTGFSESGGVHRATLDLPDQAGVHTLTVTVTGRLDDGTAFERTLVGSFAVVPKGAEGPWTGR